MWKDLSAEWRAVFEEAWEAFKSGGVPIGAAIFDENGALLVRERNRSGEAATLNKNISHAEANALRRLDTSACDVRRATLFTTMEPCPMCMGTAVMSNIKRLRYAARDPYCGCVRLKDDVPYIRGKGLDYALEGGEPEFFQLVVQSYFELRGGEKGRGGGVLDRFARLSPGAVAAAKKLYAEKALDACADVSEAYDAVVCMRKSSPGEEERFAELDGTRLPQAAELFREAFGREPWNDDWSDEARLLEYMKEISSAYNALNFGLFMGERLVAVSIGSLRHWWEGTNYVVEEFCVAPETQGRGVGTRFMAAIEADILARGADGIFLQTDADKPAYKFYKKNGFGDLGEHISLYKRLKK